MVSTVEGQLREDVGLTELLEATFPGGSVTGAPKISAIDHIAALEPVGRGASMGAIGRVHPNGDLDLALTIRTFAVAEGRIHLWVGGGIVWDSDPEAEIEESLVKARPLLERSARRCGSRSAVEPARGGGRRARPRPAPTSRCCPPTTRRCSAGAPRSRRCASTAAGRSGSPSTSRGCRPRPSGSASRWPGRLRGARRRGARRRRRARRGAAALPDAGREGADAPVSLALVSSLPDDLEERRRAGSR